jgi:hypothetical protein
MEGMADDSACMRLRVEARRVAARSNELPEPDAGDAPCNLADVGVFNTGVTPRTGAGRSTGGAGTFVVELAPALRARTRPEELD